MKELHGQNRRRDLEVQVGGHVFLKVSPPKGVMRFGNKGKLCFYFEFLSKLELIIALFST